MTKLISYTLFTITALLSIFLSLSTAASVPQTIGYQGVLRDSAGGNINGNSDFRVRYYTSAVGGGVVYEEEFLSRSVVGGGFSVELGSGTVISGSFSSIDFSNPVFITFNTKLSSSASYDGEMNPRVPLNSVPYALNSQNLQGKTVGGANGVVAYDSTTSISANNATFNGVITAGTGLTPITTISGTLNASALTFADNSLQSVGTSLAINNALNGGITTTVNGLSLSLNVNNGLELGTNGLGLTSTCSLNETLKWNGTSWICGVFSDTQTLSFNNITRDLTISNGNSVTIPQTTYTAGAGLNLTGTQFTNSGLLSLTAGFGISNTGTAQNPVLENTLTLGTIPGVLVPTDIQSSTSDGYVLTSQAGNTLWAPIPASVVTLQNGTSLFSTGIPGAPAGANSLAQKSIFLGQSAGDSANNANFSFFIGSGAGYNAVNASYSTFIGNGAGSNAFNASNSIFIGSNAGQDDGVNNIATFGSSILIGNDTSTGGFTNSIVLGAGGANTKVNQLLIPSSYTNLSIGGVEYTVPSIQGTTGQSLVNDGLGNLSWSSILDTNIANTNLTLTGNRVLNRAGNTLSFTNGDLNVTGTSTFGDIVPGGPYTGNVSGFTLGKTNKRWDTAYINQLVLGPASYYIEDTAGTLTFRSTNSPNPGLVIDPTFGGYINGNVQINRLPGYPELSLLFNENPVNGADLVGIKAPDSLTASYSLTLPQGQGTAGQSLVNDGFGNLSWATGFSGANLQSAYDFGGAGNGSSIITTNGLSPVTIQTNSEVSNVSKFGAGFTVGDIGLNKGITLGRSGTGISGASTIAFGNTTNPLLGNAGYIKSGDFSSALELGSQTNGANLSQLIFDAAGNVNLNSTQGIYATAFGPGGDITYDAQNNLSLIGRNNASLFSNQNIDILSNLGSINLAAPKNIFVQVPTASNTNQISLSIGNAVNGSEISLRNSGLQFYNNGLLSGSGFFAQSTAADQYFQTGDLSTSSKITTSANGVRFLFNDFGDPGVINGNGYYFPKTTGLAGQVLTSDGIGQLDWTTATTANFANTDLTATGDRYHNFNNYGLSILNTTNFEVGSLYSSSIKSGGFGSAANLDLAGGIATLLTGNLTQGANSTVELSTNGINFQTSNNLFGFNSGLTLQNGDLTYKNNLTSFEILKAKANGDITLGLYPSNRNDPAINALVTPTNFLYTGNAGELLSAPLSVLNSSTGANFANTDLTATGDRTHNFANNNLSINQVKGFQLSATQYAGLYSSQVDTYATNQLNLISNGGLGNVNITATGLLQLNANTITWSLPTLNNSAPQVVTYNPGTQKLEVRDVGTIGGVAAGLKYYNETLANPSYPNSIGSGNNVVAIGAGNSVNGSNNYTFGSNNSGSTFSSGNTTIGNSNSNGSGQDVAILGNDNAIGSGFKTIVLGFNNSNPFAGFSGIFGNNNSVLGSGSFAIGSTLTNTLSGSVDIGTNDTTKLSIYNDGTLTVRGALSVAGTTGNTGDVLVSRGVAQTPIWQSLGAVTGGVTLDGAYNYGGPGLGNIINVLGGTQAVTVSTAPYVNTEAFKVVQNESGTGFKIYTGAGRGANPDTTLLQLDSIDSRITSTGPLSIVGGNNLDLYSDAVGLTSTNTLTLQTFLNVGTDIATYGPNVLRLTNNQDSVISTLATGNGSPEGVVTANTGSLYQRGDGNLGEQLYLKTTNGTNIGWIAIGGASVGGVGPITIQNTNSLVATGLPNPAGVGAINAQNSNFFGAGAGNGATDAAFSNFLGFQAGSGATSAGGSNFLGLNAGIDALTAGNSNFFGTNAGNSATNAYYSNFIGNVAGRDAVNANDSNFIGNNSGNGATYANNSNFIGYQSGFGATKAPYSNFIGSNAGVNALTASFSNFIGAGAGYAATFAKDSTFIGNGAGVYAVNANNSLFIGKNAGNNDTVNNVSGGSSILIGDNTSTGGFSNSIVLGANGTNTAANQFKVAPQYTGLSLGGVDYIVPTTQGTAGQVLTNNGSGLLNWSNISAGGLKYYAESTGTPNIAPSANPPGAIAIGDGAVANSGLSIVIGNNAIAYGQNTYIYAGDQNSVNGNGSSLFAGNSNNILGQGNVIHANRVNNLTANDSSIIGQSYNNVTVDHVDVFGRYIDTATGYWAGLPQYSEAFGNGNGGLAIGQNGNAGFGTLAPQNKVEINSGSTNTSGLRFTNLTTNSATSTVNGKALTVDANGDVVLVDSGTSPITIQNGSTLLSSGISFIPNTGALDSVFLGYAAGHNADQSNFSNFIGAYAGYGNQFNSGIATNASFSNFIGNSAGYGAAKANNSIFIGDSAGFDDTVVNIGTGLGADSSILIGNYTSTAGYKNSIALGAGAINTASNQFKIAPSYTGLSLGGVDYTVPTAQGTAGQVLTNNGTGLLSWANASGISPITIQNGNSLFSTGLTIPSGAGAANATDSIFLGENAGGLAINAIGSVFLGTNAGQNATNAYSSNFFGPYAGSNATNARNSIFIGDATGENATNALQSTFLGVSAGNGAVNANNSLFIGNSAGLNDQVNNINPGNNSILIGDNTSTGGFSNSIVLGAYGVNTASDQLAIGDSYTKLRLGGVNYTVPTVQGTAGQVLTNDGTGLLSWQSAGAGSSPITVQNGNSLFSTGLTNPAGTTGITDSIFLGESAGSNAGAAGDSVFIGRIAGQNATNAFQSVFLGSGAGFGATNATNGVFVGPGAGLDATNAVNGTFIGRGAGFAATNAYNSTILGADAGINAFNAANSIFIGNLAGSYDTVTNGVNDYSILIGANTKTGGFSNSIAIGTGAINTANNQFKIASSYTKLSLGGVDYTVPTAQGSAGQVLTNNGTGLLSWQNVTGGTGCTPGGTGIANYCIGAAALRLNTTGNSNIAIGLRSLEQNDTGSQNVAIGYDSLNTNTTGASNTALGTFSLGRNTTGVENTATGQGALGRNSAGQGNTATGFEAVGFNLSGEYNSGFGYNALRYNSSGRYNSAFGYNALYSSTGNRNTAVGLFAGYNLLTGSSNIALGNETNFADENGSNQLNIGNAIFGTGLSGSVLAPAGFIGIGTNAPTAKLEVASGTANTSGLKFTSLTSASPTSTGQALGVDASGNVVTISSGAVNQTTTFVPNSSTYTILSTDTTLIANQLSSTQIIIPTAGSVNGRILTVVNNTPIVKSFSLPYNAVDGSGAPSIIPAYSTITIQSNGGTGSSAWQQVGGSVSGWSLLGNAGTNSATNFIGTTDAQSLVFRVNNLSAGSIQNVSKSVYFGENSGNTTSNTSPFYNVGIGYQTLGAVTVGNNNIALGYRSLALTVGGSNNVASGSNSLSNNVNGNNNVAIGFNSMLTNVAGSANVAVGYQSLYASTGNQNTATGFFAMSGNTTGNANSAFGRQALAGNTTGSENTAIGYQAGLTQTAGDNNIFIGRSTTVANTTGSNQLSIGNTIYGTELALATSKIGIGTSSPTEKLEVSGNIKGDRFVGYGLNGVGSNSAVGALSLLSNTSGGGNTANGVEALRSNTTGNNNTANGNNALVSNTIGSGNTASGTQSLRFNTTGSDNTASGVSGLTANTIGTSNTANGSRALSANTSGNNNSAFGRDSMLSNITGNNNSAFGVNSLANNTTGVNNIGFGSNTLFLNATGSNNTAVGLSAGLTQTSGDNNIFIGQGTSVASTAGSNQLSIGNTIYGLELGLSTSKIGIGTNAPTAKLEIASGIANTSGLKFTSLTSVSPTSTGQALGVDASGNVVSIASVAGITSYCAGAQIAGGAPATGVNGFGAACSGGNDVGAANQLSIGTKSFSGLNIITNNVNRISIGDVGGVNVYSNLTVTNSTGAVAIFNGASEALRITAAGNTGFRNVNPLYSVDAVNTGGQIRFGNASSDAGGFLWSNGNNNSVSAAGYVWNGSQFIAKGTIATSVIQNAGSFAFTSDSTTSGSAFTPTTRFSISSNGFTTTNGLTSNGNVSITSSAANTSGLNFANLTSASPTTTGQAIGVDASGNVVTITAGSGGGNLQSAYNFGGPATGNTITVNSTNPGVAINAVGNGGPTNTALSLSGVGGSYEFLVPSFAGGQNRINFFGTGGGKLASDYNLTLTANQNNLVIDNATGLSFSANAFANPRFSVASNGNTKLNSYTSARNDSVATPPVNFLYTDSSGNLLSAPTSLLSAGGSTTASNGLTSTAGNITLGGILANTTIIDGNFANGLNFTKTNLTLDNTNAAGTTGLIKFGTTRFISNAGISNSFVGQNSGNTTLTGDSNSGFGANTLNAVSTGVFNTAVGTQGLSLSTTGSNNTAIGAGALLQTSTASNNVAIGSATGLNLLTGSDNILIGTNVDTQLGNTSNFMSLGNAIFATGLNSTSILSTTKIGIGTLSPTNKLTVEDLNTTSVSKFSGSGSTQCTIVTGTGITCSSDSRLKQNIISLDSSTQLINQLKPVTYQWKQGNGESQVGFIAQDVETVIPGLVSTNSDGFKSLNTTGIIPYLVKAFQEQQTQIDEIKTRLGLPTTTLQSGELSVANETRFIDMISRLTVVETKIIEHNTRIELLEAENLKIKQEKLDQDARIKKLEDALILLQNPVR
jgi:trimeric autotransporter adhesin